MIATVRLLWNTSREALFRGLLPGAAGLSACIAADGDAELVDPAEDVGRSDIKQSMDAPAAAERRTIKRMWRSVALPAVALALGACVGGDGSDDEALLSADQAVTSQPHGQPSYMRRSTSYSVRIKDSDDADWKPVDVIGDINGYDYVHFSMAGGACQIEVTVKGASTISRYTISPERDTIPGSVNGNKLTYTLSNDKYTIVWISGTNQKLIVAADPVHTAPNPSDAGVFNVMNDSGVKNDRNNISNTTNGIQAAIDAASSYGGANGGRGIVYVPAGAYAVGNITLKSNMELYLAEGAAFFFAGNVDGDRWNYTYRTDWTSKGNGTRWIATQDGASNIKIWGRGTLDGNALGSGSFQNNVLVLNNNRDVTVEGIVIKAASKWGTLIGRSENVTFSNVKFFQHMSGVGEDDALDVIESQDVMIKSSIGASFDDSFSVKTYDYSEDYIDFGGEHQAAQNITFDDLIAWTGCHAFKIGQGAGQPIDNVTFKNSVVFDAAHAVSLHHKAGVATVQNVTWNNIDVQKIGQTNLGRSWAYVNIENTATGPGKVKDITVANIRVRDTGTDSSPLKGLDSVNNVEGIFFRDIHVGPSGNAFFAQNAADARLVRNEFVSNLQVSQNGVRMFWDRDAVKVEGAPDWSPSNFKGNCGPDEAMTGMSQSRNSGQRGPHALRCKSYGPPFNDTFVASQAVSSSGDSYRSGTTNATYDWDPGYAKTECGRGEYVSGVSQDMSAHSLKHLRCASADSISNACNSKSVMTDDRGEDTGDWDPGYFKAECDADMVVVGVSVNASGMPRRILCCHR